MNPEQSLFQSYNSGQYSSEVSQPKDNSIHWNAELAAQAPRCPPLVVSWLEAVHRSGGGYRWHARLVRDSRPSMAVCPDRLCGDVTEASVQSVKVHTFSYCYTSYEMACQPAHQLLMGWLLEGSRWPYTWDTK